MRTVQHASNRMIFFICKTIVARVTYIPLMALQATKLSPNVGTNHLRGEQRLRNGHWLLLGFAWLTLPLAWDRSMSDDDDFIQVDYSKYKTMVISRPDPSLPSIMLIELNRPAQYNAANARMHTEVLRNDSPNDSRRAICCVHVSNARIPAHA